MTGLGAVVGLEHPSALSFYLNSATAIRQKEDFVKAEGYFQKFLKGRLRVLNG